MKHRKFSLIGGWWKMRTHGHREGSTKHWGLFGGKGEGQRGVRELRGDSLGRNAKCGWRGGRQQITLPCVYLCNNLACSSHVPQNLKCNKKNAKNLKKFSTITNVFNTKNLIFFHNSLCCWEECELHISYKILTKARNDIRKLILEHTITGNSVWSGWKQGLWVWMLLTWQNFSLHLSISVVIIMPNSYCMLKIKWVNKC